MAFTVMPIGAMAADSKSGALRQLEVMWKAEKYAIAAWEVRDVEELKEQDQTLRDVQLVSPEEARISNEYDCGLAVGAMTNLVSGMRRIISGEASAKDVVRTRDSYAHWQLYIGNCEAGLGKKRPRVLVIDELAN